jgi:hypothetical protein
VSHEWLSGEQVGRYGRFVADPTPEELERFFFLDEAALAEVRTRRGLHNKLGWSVQWGTVRMLGTFLTDSGPVQVKSGKLHMSRLEAAPLPEGFKAVHDAVQAMLPRIDYPELLLETHGRTGMFDCMEHISGAHLRRDDLDISPAALTVARSCNVGLVPVIKAGAAALTEHRLLGVEKGYFHGGGIAGASARLVDKQAGIDITADWGGGLVASVDGMRFVVPVRSLHSRPSPLYWGIGKRPRGFDLAEHGLGQGDGTWRSAGSRHATGLAVHSGRHPPPGRDRAPRGHHDGPGKLQRHRVRPVRDLRLPVRAAHADIADTQLWWADTAMLDGELTRNTRAANGWGDSRSSMSRSTAG